MCDKNRCRLPEKINPMKISRPALVLFQFVLFFFALISSIQAEVKTDSSASSDRIEKNKINNHAAYIEIMGSAMNFFSLNYEYHLRDNLHLRLGGSYLGFSSELRDENEGNDLFIRLRTLPVTLSRTLFDKPRQFEFGGGATLLSYTFTGGPYHVGYFDIELGNRYRGIALTGMVNYRITAENFLFRIGLFPHYMLTLNSEVSGYFEELDERGVTNFESVLDLRGFRIIPGLSFGRTF